jgi:transposase
MVKKDMFQDIQKLKRQGATKSKISRDLKLDMKTVAKYYSMDDEEYCAAKNDSMYRSKIFGPFTEEILSVYKSNDYQKLNVAAVYDYLEERYNHLPGSEKTLRNYINYLIITNQLVISEKMRTYSTVPEMPPGKQMQLDFGEFKCSSGLRLYIFATVLSCSRFKYTAFQDRPFTTDNVIHHLLNCFDYIGGVPHELVIDQDKLMVVSENKGDIIYTKDFSYFIEEMNLSMYVCRKADPESKGKIENLIKFIKYNFLATRDFDNIPDAQESLFLWLKRRANGKVCQATKKIPAIVIETERPALQEIKNSIFRKESITHRDSRQANEKALISFNASQYQLPVEYKNRNVDIYATNVKLFVFDSYSGREIAEHMISHYPGKIVSDRKYRRMTEVSAKDLKETIKDMFDLELWEEFVSKNFKTFPRFVRDQCIDALNKFSVEKTGKEILQQALSYCLENETYSFANLHDTYRHFIYAYNDTEDVESCKEIPEPAKSTHHGSVPVKKRDIGTYTSIIN